MTEDIYIPVEPFALQMTQEVRVKPGTEGDCESIRGRVVLVDTASRYVSVMFQGTTVPVALPADEWRFELKQDLSHIPQEDGMYVQEDEAALSMADVSALYVRKSGEWRNMMGDPTEILDVLELPPLSPLRAMPTPKASPAAPVDAPPTGSAPVVEEPPALES